MKMNIGRNGRAPPGLPISPGPGDPPPIPDPGVTIARALARPLGAPALDRFVEPGDRVAVLQDSTLPPDLRALAAARVAEALDCAGASEVTWLEVSASPRATREGDGGPGAEARLPEIFTDPDATSEDGGRPRANAYLAAGRAPGLGIVRLSAPVVRADKLVLVCRASGALLVGGCGALVAWGSADEPTRHALLRSCAVQSLEAASAATERWQRAVEEVLLLAPPAFALQLALQRSDRLTAVVAGAPETMTPQMAERP